MVISSAMNNIQKVMTYFSSVTGFMVIVFIPIILIFKYREKLIKSNITSGNLNKSFLNRKLHLYICSFVGLFLACLIVFGMFSPNNKQCVAEDVK
jgi:hypothetical protein